MLEEKFVRNSMILLYVLSWPMLFLGVWWMGKEYADSLRKYFQYKYYHQSVKTGSKKAYQATKTKAIEVHTKAKTKARDVQTKTRNKAKNIQTKARAKSNQIKEKVKRKIKNHQNNY